ncbi:MAG: type II secretion system protein M [Deltaproteobacteria bacterium]|nr:type II secretion system protein M [Deltaproteobacteria bacterium]
MKKITGIDKKRKYFLIAIVFLLIAGTIYRMWPQIEDVFASNGTIALKKKQLVKYQKMLQSTRNLEKQVALTKKIVEQSESGLLTGKTPALAAADIQKVIREMAKKSQMEIQSIRVLKPKDVDKSLYLSIPVEFVAKGVIRELRGFLYQIAASPKYLTVEKVQISLVLRRNRNTKSGKLENITANITINGFLKK